MGMEMESDDYAEIVAGMEPTVDSITNTLCILSKKLQKGDDYTKSGYPIEFALEFILKTVFDWMGEGNSKELSALLKKLNHCSINIRSAQVLNIAYTIAVFLRTDNRIKAVVCLAGKDRAELLKTLVFINKNSTPGGKLIKTTSSEQDLSKLASAGLIEYFKDEKEGARITWSGIAALKQIGSIE